LLDVGKFYGYLVYFTAISYILWKLGIFVAILVYFYSFGMSCQEKSGNPGLEPLESRLSVQFIFDFFFDGAQGDQIRPIFAVFWAACFNCKHSQQFWATFSTVKVIHQFCRECVGLNFG
jgi:hypothetical protein